MNLVSINGGQRSRAGGQRADRQDSGAMSDAELPDTTGSPEPVGSPEPLRFTCPRCLTEVTAAFYGPCDTCRATLRATLGGDAREVEVGDYEPKMNVTPNAVATKD